MWFDLRYIDDLDGTDLGETSNTISFAFEGNECSIGLSDDNAEAFREAVAPYVEAGYRVTGSKANTARKTAATSGNAKAIREWARNNGYDVSDRGRIPASLADAYTTGVDRTTRPSAQRPQKAIADAAQRNRSLNLS